MLEQGCYKLLRLISPQEANKLGIEAEAPVFVSPIVNAPTKCYQCKKEFGPLVYQVGQEVVPHHYHPRSAFLSFHRGGIYFFRCKPDLTLTADKWLARLDPLGEIEESLSESARITKISAYCGYKPCNTEIKSGVVLAKMSLGDGLNPFCDSSLENNPSILEENKPIFRFQSNPDGSITFSSL